MKEINYNCLIEFLVKVNDSSINTNSEFVVKHKPKDRLFGIINNQSEQWFLIRLINLRHGIVQFENFLNYEDGKYITNLLSTYEGHEALVGYISYNGTDDRIKKILSSMRSYLKLQAFI